MFAPEQFMLWSMKILPVRSATFHAIVTRSRISPFDQSSGCPDQTPGPCRRSRCRAPRA